MRPRHFSLSKVFLDLESVCSTHLFRLAAFLVESCKNGAIGNNLDNEMEKTRRSVVANLFLNKKRLQECVVAGQSETRQRGDGIREIKLRLSVWLVMGRMCQG